MRRIFKTSVLLHIDRQTHSDETSLIICPQTLQTDVAWMCDVFSMRCRSSDTLRTGQVASAPPQTRRMRPPPPRTRTAAAAASTATIASAAAPTTAVAAAAVQTTAGPAKGAGAEGWGRTAASTATTSARSSTLRRSRWLPRASARTSVLCRRSLTAETSVSRRRPKNSWTLKTSTTSNGLFVVDERRR